ncbi:MAG: 4-hydroxythreonine-4-phosphate dehydrogenase PdxA [Candidatus Coatesbacteria bacterium]|nr:4-hydroxythreonine-4-phosphate dehydrogenase PdxA [Candidatus Coatesbacteria bacterium]
MRQPIIAITMGDPAGVGPEVIVKAHRILVDEKRPVNALVIGDFDLLKKVSEQTGSGIELSKIDETEVSRVPLLVRDNPEVLHVLDLANVEPEALSFGEPDMFTGKAAIDYIVTSLRLCKSESVSAIATAPVSKKAICDAGITFTGHTELIANTMGVRDFAMMFVCKGLRVLLLTTHIPLSSVSSHVNERNVRRLIFLTERTLTGFFGVAKPKIGVCGLNPHAGEDGVIGREEVEDIIPAIKSARREKIDVRGPYPADTLFTPEKTREFDAIIAMYHDQGLIPVKMTDFRGSVNVTVGLPIVRVSVSHGTASDIAGKWVADPSSMVESLKLADRMTRTLLAGQNSK